MDDTEAAKAFFDFRVADISMGSGHFLITAVDYIERGMADYLVKRRLPGVFRELEAFAIVLGTFSGCFTFFHLIPVLVLAWGCRVEAGGEWCTLTASVIGILVGLLVFYAIVVAWAMIVTAYERIRVGTK